MVLYHASQRKYLSLIKPQSTLSNNKYIGDFIFATKNKMMALMYLVPKGIPILMNPTGPVPDIVICGDVSRFLTKDIGGAIYELSATNFNKTPQEGLSEYEMVSTKPVKPIRKTIYKSTLEALLSAGVQVRFTDETTFYRLIGNPNQKVIIKTLPIYIPQ